MYGYFREKLHVNHFWELKASYKCYLEDFPTRTGEFSLREILILPAISDNGHSM